MRSIYAVSVPFHDCFVELYHLKSTCYFNEQMEYCPVLVELA
jgi:hypothetical protein